MALGIRQTRLYTHEVDIYLPVNIGDVSIGNQDILDLHYNSTPAYTNVKCYRKTNPRLSTGHMFGREKVDTTTANIEEWHFDSLQDINENYACQLVGGPDTSSYGEWYYIVSEPDTNTYRSNVGIVFVKKTTKPPGVA